jgi:hypothetical protein
MRSTFVKRRVGPRTWEELRVVDWNLGTRGYPPFQSVGVGAVVVMGYAVLEVALPPAVVLLFGALLVRGQGRDHAAY